MSDARKAAKHAEIARRYARKHKRRHVSLASLRVHDLNRLFRARYGELLPDDDSGRDDCLVMVHHLAALSGDPRKRIGQWLRLWAPWLSLLEAEGLLVEAISKPHHWRADKLAWRLRLLEADRATLRITTIGAIDMGKAERTKRRKARHRDLARLRREASGAKPRAEYEASSVNRAKPWITEGISRRTWYRRHNGTRGTSP